MKSALKDNVVAFLNRKSGKFTEIEKRPSHFLLILLPSLTKEYRQNHCKRFTALNKNKICRANFGHALANTRTTMPQSHR